MPGSKSHNTSLERLHELTSRHEYMSEFVDKLMAEIQTPKNIHLVKTNEYLNMMRKLSFFHENRIKISKRGYELSNQPEINAAELEELHLIRMLDGGVINGIWISIKEFIDSTGLDIEIDNSRM